MSRSTSSGLYSPIPAILKLTLLSSLHRDLRANPRTLIEGQIVGMRVGWARVVETLGYSRALLAPSAAGPGNYFSSAASHYGGYVADPWGQQGGGGGLLRPGVGLGIRTPTRTGGNSPTGGGSPRGGSPLQRQALPPVGLQHRTSVHAVPLLPGGTFIFILIPIFPSNRSPLPQSKTPPYPLVLQQLLSIPMTHLASLHVSSSSVLVLHSPASSISSARFLTPLYSSLEMNLVYPLPLVPPVHPPPLPLLSPTHHTSKHLRCPAFLDYSTIILWVPVD